MWQLRLTCLSLNMIISAIMLKSDSMAPSLPQLILFDCDGTLTNSHGSIVTAMQQAFDGAGLIKPSDAEVASIIGLSLHRAVVALLDKEQADEAAVEAVCAGYRDAYREAEQHIRLFVDVRETLEELRKRGYWMGVVTGKSLAGLLRVLETFALSEYFMVMRTADCTHSKPDPAMVLECMHEMGVSAGQTVVVGDALFDVQMARAASVPAIGVSFGVAESCDLMDAGAKVVVDDFAALLDYFPALQDHA